MRIIQAQDIIDAVRELCIQSNIILPGDLQDLIEEKAKQETGELAKSALKDMCENMAAAKEMNIPVCQDTGMAVVFAEIGNRVFIDADFEEAVNEGVRQGYSQGYLRASVVANPLMRTNTGDNTPAVIHTRLVSGEKLKLTVAPKGFGSENMSALKMMMPSQGAKDIIDFVRDTVINAGGNPCPPVVIGVGIGGNFELCALLAKKALCRDVSQQNPDPFYSSLEKEILEELNSTGIGPQGFGGDTTALAVMIESFPTHIAGLPVAVNIGCHVTRHSTAVI